MCVSVCVRLEGGKKEIPKKGRKEGSDFCKGVFGGERGGGKDRSMKWRWGGITCRIGRLFCLRCSREWGG